MYYGPGEFPGSRPPDYPARLGQACKQLVNMEAIDVLRVLERLRNASISAYVAGGWGVDALVGEQSRPHNDLDLAIDAADESRLLPILCRAGFQMVTDERPVRFVLQDSEGRKIDFHPVTFDAAGDGTQVGFGGSVYQYPSVEFGRGIIDGKGVDCLSAKLLIQFHLGFVPTEKDRRDMHLLRERLGIALPSPYS
jgi:lincosamide nucleotidyltransferase A/C/D/E